ncbi:hypothetical protein N6H14_24305 [Paenibacillus sp. CC-CFT747]|nr:hypothetical protein N6H14_24305 [Paenibacillus sp. CC-CFT747]
MIGKSASLDGRRPVSLLISYLPKSIGMKQAAYQAAGFNNISQPVPGYA